MKIKWIGKYDGKNLPTVDVEVGAKELPEVTSKSAIILIPIVLLFACCVYIKKTYLGGVAFSRVDWMIGLVIALLFFPVHELIHAVSFPAGSEVIMFYTTQGLGTTCTSPMTRNMQKFLHCRRIPGLRTHEQLHEIIHLYHLPQRFSGARPCDDRTWPQLHR